MKKHSKNKFVVFSLTALAIFSSGCGVVETRMENLPYVEVPWHWFLTEEDKQSLQEQERVLLPVFPLNLEDDSDAASIQHWNKVVHSLSEKVAQPSFYLDGAIDRASFEKTVTDIVKVEGAEVFSESLFSLLEYVYTQPYKEAYSLSFVSYERERGVDGETLTVLMHLNTMGDEQEFEVYPLYLEIDNNDILVKSDWDKEPERRTNTARNLSTEAFLEEGGHETAIQVVEKLKEHMTHPSITESMTQDAEKALRMLDGQIVDLAPKLGIKDVEGAIDVVREWMEISKGESIGVLTAVLYTDEEAKPRTVYTLSVPDEENIHQFEITFDRAEQVIEKMTKRN